MKYSDWHLSYSQTFLNKDSRTAKLPLCILRMSDTCRKWGAFEKFRCKEERPSKCGYLCGTRDYVIVFILREKKGLRTAERKMSKIFLAQNLENTKRNRILSFMSFTL